MNLKHKGIPFVKEIENNLNVVAWCKKNNIPLSDKDIKEAMNEAVVTAPDDMKSNVAAMALLNKIIESGKVTVFTSGLTTTFENMGDVSEANYSAWTASCFKNGECFKYGNLSKNYCYVIDSVNGIINRLQTVDDVLEAKAICHEKSTKLEKLQADRKARLETINKKYKELNDESYEVGLAYQLGSSDLNNLRWDDKVFDNLNVASMQTTFEFKWPWE